MSRAGTDARVYSDAPPIPDEAFAALRGAIGMSIGQGAMPLREAIDQAVAAERGGLDIVTAPDSASETFSLLGAAAARTSSITLMSGIAQWSRTPVGMAHAAESTQNIAEGRYWLGIGPMPRPWAEDWHGLEYQPVGARLRDYVAATRAALAATPEQPTAHDGPYFRTVGFPGHDLTPKRAVPLQLAATRPRMTAIAAEIADGVMFNAIQPLGWLAGEGAEAIAEGLARGGRPRERFAVGVFRFCGIDDDRAVAYDHARDAIKFYFAIPYFRALLEPLGFGDELDAGEAALAAGDLDAQKAAVSDALVDALGIVGTPDDAIRKLRAVQQHADYVILGGGPGQPADVSREQAARIVATFGPRSRRSQSR